MRNIVGDLDQSKETMNNTLMKLEEFQKYYE